VRVAQGLAAETGQAAGDQHGGLGRDRGPLPAARVRLSAGRTRLTREGQALCFFAGANSIFYGDKLLTAANPGVDADRSLLDELGLGIAKPEPVSIL